MKTYYKNNFIFAELNEAQIKELKDIEPERMFVSEDNIKRINKILELEKQETEESLRAIRNSVVEMFSDMVEEDGHIGEDNMTRMSMITAVIDNCKWEKGFAV